MKRVHYYNSGFTLIELLIVIGIIATLMTVFIISTKGIREESDILAAQGDLKQIKMAVESYYTHNRAYPTSLTYLLTAKPTILPNLPQDRFNKCCNYNYEVIKDEYYIIWSNGHNKKKDYKLNADKTKILKSTIDDDIIESNMTIE